MKHITETDLGGVPLVTGQSIGSLLVWNGDNWVNTDPLLVSISFEDDTLIASVAGGTPDYTYSWELSQNANLLGGASGTQAATTPTSQTTEVTVSGAGGSGTQFLWKCTVTDANGLVAVGYYLLTTPGA